VIVITPTTEKQSIVTVLSGKTYFPVRIQASITETNPALTRVGATLNWNDGTPPVRFTPSKPLVIDTTRNLFIGTYYITLSAFNYLQPKAETVNAYFSVMVQPQAFIPVPQQFLFGPILPLDNSFPNALQWNFNTASNLDVLKSAVKMLLITTKGERIMQPTYGTLLRRVIFEQNSNSISTTIRQEITEALALFEPRVSLDNIDIENLDDRSVVVNATFLSKISQATFSLEIPVSR
jgi:phage baseplate assembly protein W